MLQEKKNKFKPIIQEELQEFAHKVDKIVEYLTFKKKEDRNIKPADPQIPKVLPSCSDWPADERINSKVGEW